MLAPRRLRGGGEIPWRKSVRRPRGSSRSVRQGLPRRSWQGTGPQEGSQLRANDPSWRGL
jgi:hypothetical protein